MAWEPRELSWRKGDFSAGTHMLVSVDVAEDIAARPGFLRISEISPDGLRRIGRWGGFDIYSDPELKGGTTMVFDQDPYHRAMRTLMEIADG